MSTRVAAVTVVLLAGVACAQCTKDIECKGERVCVAGQCVEPVAAPGGAGAMAPAASGVPRGPSAADFAQRRASLRTSHWAGPASVLGFATGAVVLSLGVGAALFNGTDASIVLGAASLIAAMVGAPLVAVGGASARFDATIPGSPVTRVVGWAGYSLAVLLGVGMVAYSVSTGATMGTGLILSVALLGASSLACLALDALASGAQADEAVALGRGDDGSWPPAPRPFMWVAPLPLGGAALGGGLTGVF